MCLCARMLALEWKERAFIETVNSRWFFVDFRRPYLCTTTVHKYDVSIQSSTKVRETSRQITQKLSVGHKDRRLGKIVYILVFYNISFSWLLPLDAFQFISPTPYPFRRLLRRLFFSPVFIAWRWNRSIELYPLALSLQMCSKNYWLRSIHQRRYFKTSSPLYSKLWN